MLDDTPGPSDHGLTRAATAGVYVYLNIMLLGAVAQVSLLAFAISIAIRRPQKLQGRRLQLLMASLTICVVYCTSVAIMVWDIVAILAGIRLTSSLQSLGVSTVFTVMYILVGDSLMLWRCYAICCSHPVMSLLPASLISTSFAFGMVSVVNTFKGQPSDLVSTLWVAFSVAANILVTSLILRKLLVDRRAAIASSMDDEPPKVYRDMIIILIESAAPLAVAGLLTIIMEAIRLSSASSSNQYNALYFLDLVANLLFLLFSALSPQMVLFRSITVASGQIDADSRSSERPQFSTIQYFA